jgi:large subunit ribosomal protein L29
VKAAEIRDLTDDELGEKLREAREALFNLRFQNASGALERTSEMKIRRQDIARMLTVARQREATSG